MAGGDATRCDGKIKQLFEIDGEPIIDRTIRLINEIKAPHDMVYVATHRMDLCRPGASGIYAHGKSLAESMLMTRPIWMGNYDLVFLMSDVIYDKDTLLTIVDYSTELMVHGRLNCHKHGLPERYAISVGRSVGGRRLRWLAHRLSECMEHPLKNEVPCLATIGIPWLFGSWHDKPGIRGYLYWHVLLHYVAGSVPMIEVRSPWVRDIDTLEELEDYRRQYEPFVPH